MAEYDAQQQDWLKPHNSFATDSLPNAAPPPRVTAGYDLRPLSTGEILDRTFTLYRSRFWLYTGIASITACLRVVSTAGYLTLVKPPGQVGANPLLGSMIGAAVFFVGAVLALVAYSITQAATVSAVSAVYLGRETSVSTALSSVRGHWFRYVLIALWQSWSAGWIFFLLIIPAFAIPAMGVRNLGSLIGLMIFLAFASLIYGMIAYLRNSLAVPAAVVEDLRVPAAMRRSKLLSHGGKFRIFLLFLLLGALSMVAGMLTMPFSVMLMQSRSGEHIIAQAIMLVITFISASVVAPVGAIGLCLFYVDERVRKEAFDIEFLMERSAPPIPQAASTEPV
jgi:hypothetical protein